MPHLNSLYFPEYEYLYSTAYDEKRACPILIFGVNMIRITVNFRHSALISMETNCLIYHF